MKNTRKVKRKRGISSRGDKLLTRDPLTLCKQVLIRLYLVVLVIDKYYHLHS